MVNIDDSNQNNIENNIENETENNIEIDIENTENITLFEKISNFFKNNAFFIILIIVILVYIFLFSSLGNKNSKNTKSISDSLDSVKESVTSISDGDTGTKGESKSNGKYAFELLLWSMFILLIMLNGVLYIFNIDVITSVKNLLGNVPEVEIVVDSDGIKPVIKVKKDEVYHIPDNLYDYETAKAICKARDARLATYEELSDAYDKGADWCGYGWSEGQMALFPTQMEKWEKLQEIEGHENDCGRPGINGGFIDNPNVRFGINCFGVKHPITYDESVLMAETSLYPTTKKEIEFNKKVDYWKTKISDILLSPFSHNNWSVF